MQIRILPEHEVTEVEHRQITALRNSCFPGFERQRSYFKQLPHLRVLGYKEDRLVAYLGIDHRVARFGKGSVTIFGIIDLCVNEADRGQGIATALLQEVEQVARRSRIDALVLMASDQRLYQRHGFAPIKAEASWLRIEDHSSYGVASENLGDELMGKALSTGLTLEGPVDFLGYLF